MRLFVETLFLVLLFSSFCFSQQEPLPVVSSRWQRTVMQGQTPDNPAQAPMRAVTNDNKYFQRKNREGQTNVTVDPNDTTEDGRRAAMDKAVQESRTRKAADVPGYSYVAEVRNASGKKIAVVYWEYRFTEIANPANTVRRQFLCAANLKNGGAKALSAFSTLGPSDVIDASSLAKSTEKLFNEDVRVNRIEFEDGSILQRPDWKFDDVKKAVEDRKSNA